MHRSKFAVLTTLLALAGCAALSPAPTAREREYQAKASEAAAAAATTVAAAAVPPPWGSLLAAAIAAVGTAAATYYRGKESGWTEAKGTTGKPPSP